MKLSRKKVYSLLSIITVVILSLIPGLGLFADNEFSKPHYLFGYPAKWFGYSGDFLLVFKSLICCSILLFSILSMQY